MANTKFLVEDGKLEEGVVAVLVTKTTKVDDVNDTVGAIGVTVLNNTEQSKEVQEEIEMDEIDVTICNKDESVYSGEIKLDLSIDKPGIQLSEEFMVKNSEGIDVTANVFFQNDTLVYNTRVTKIEKVLYHLNDKVNYQMYAIILVFIIAILAAYNTYGNNVLITKTHKLANNSKIAATQAKTIANDAQIAANEAQKALDANISSDRVTFTNGVNTISVTKALEALGKSTVDNTKGVKILQTVTKKTSDGVKQLQTDVNVTNSKFETLVNDVQNTSTEVKQLSNVVQNTSTEVKQLQIDVNLTNSKVETLEIDAGNTNNTLAILTTRQQLLSKEVCDTPLASLWASEICGEDKPAKTVNLWKAAAKQK